MLRSTATQIWTELKGQRKSRAQQHVLIAPEIFQRPAMSLALGGSVRSARDNLKLVVFEVLSLSGSGDTFHMNIVDAGT